MDNTIFNNVINEEQPLIIDVEGNSIDFFVNGEDLTFVEQKSNNDIVYKDKYENYYVFKVGVGSVKLSQIMLNDDTNSLSYSYKLKDKNSFQYNEYIDEFGINRKSLVIVDNSGIMLLVLHLMILIVM